MLAYLLLHFGAVLVYSNPFSSEKTKPAFYAQAFIYPYFHQNWNLFAPVPDSNYHLYCVFEDRGIQKTDVFNEIETLHQQNRLKGYAPLLLTFANSIHYFEKNTELKALYNGPINGDRNFDILVNTAKRYLNYSRSIKIQNLKLILVVEPKNKQQKFYFN